MGRAKLSATIATGAVFLAAGAGVAFIAGPTSTTGGEDVTLFHAWQTQQTASLYVKWKNANKSEAAKLEAYWTTGGSSPLLVTAFGRSWVQVGDAYWSLKTTPTTTSVTTTAPTTAPTTTAPPPPPPPPAASVYLAPNGSDANPCTQAQPCKTFARGYAAAG